MTCTTRVVRSVVSNVSSHFLCIWMVMWQLFTMAVIIMIWVQKTFSIGWIIFLNYLGYYLLWGNTLQLFSTLSKLAFKKPEIKPHLLSTLEDLVASFIRANHHDALNGLWHVAMVHVSSVQLVCQTTMPWSDSKNNLYCWNFWYWKMVNSTDHVKPQSFAHLLGNTAGKPIGCQVGVCVTWQYYLVHCQILRHKNLAATATISTTVKI